MLSGPYNARNGCTLRDDNAASLALPIRLDNRGWYLSSLDVNKQQNHDRIASYRPV